MSNKLKLGILLILNICIFLPCNAERESKDFPEYNAFICYSENAGGIMSHPILTVKFDKNNLSQKYEVILEKTVYITGGKIKRENKQYFKGTLDKDKFISIFKKLDEMGLWELPQDTKKGVSLQVIWGSRRWVNRADTGCNEYPPDLSAEHEKYSKITKFIVAVAEENAKTPIDRETFERMMHRLVY